MKHVHIWIFVKKGIAKDQKDNTPDPIVWDGHLRECECSKKMFFFDNPKLKPQEIIDD
jgi:hypothetical protein